MNNYIVNFVIDKVLILLKKKLVLDVTLTVVAQGQYLMLMALSCTFVTI